MKMNFVVSKRIDTLFVDRKCCIWRRMDEEGMTLEIDDQPSDDNTGLPELAAVETYLNGGRVYQMGRGEMPRGASVLNAVYRY